MLVDRLRVEGLNPAHVQLPSSASPHTPLPLYFYVLPLLCRRNPHKLSSGHNNTHAHTHPSLSVFVLCAPDAKSVCARSRSSDRVSLFDRDTNAPPRTWHRSGCRTGRPERERSPSSFFCCFAVTSCVIINIQEQCDHRHVSEGFSSASRVITFASDRSRLYHPRSRALFAA